MTDKRDAVIAEATEFALTKHQLFFDREENLVVGSNFIHTMADFAIQHASDVRRQIADDIYALLDEFSNDADGINAVDNYIKELRGNK